MMYFAKFFIRNFAYCEFFCFAILVYGSHYLAVNWNRVEFFMFNYFRFFLFFGTFLIKHQKVQRSQINSFWIFSKKNYQYKFVFPNFFSGNAENLQLTFFF